MDVIPIRRPAKPCVQPLISLCLVPWPRQPQHPGQNRGAVGPHCPYGVQLRHFSRGSGRAEQTDLFGFEDGKCVFLCSGSEAVEYRVRVAQMLSDRPLLMTMADSYFGAYGSASRTASDEWYCFDWAPYAGF